MNAPSSALVPVTASDLERIDPAVREVAVTQYLTDARDRLAVALEATGPQAVAALKAEIATAAEATKQLGLSREIQQDALEMVRRAEYALGKAIRAGQERGEIRKVGDDCRTDIRDGVALRDSVASPGDFASKHELTNSSGGIYDLVDGVAEPEFEAALADAKDEQNVSRANVIRKIKGVKNDGLTPVNQVVDSKPNPAA